MRVAEVTYAITARFPRDERFGMVSQMRRAAVSIGSNIAEGCGRSSAAQLLHFLQIASGSVSELQYQARLAMRLHFAEGADLERLIDETERERRMLAALIKRVRMSQQ